MRDDLRVAWRSIGRRPGFAALAIVPLAIGIGFTTAVFSIASALLIRPLPFPEGDRLMFLQSTQADAGAVSEFQVAALDFEDWRRESRSFASMGAAMPFGFNLTGVARAQRVAGARATAGLFSTLRARPFLGRFFSETEERGDASVALVSWEFWGSQFGRNPNVVGRSISLDGRPYAIVGVLPRGFRFGPRADLVVPFRPKPSELPRNTRGLNVVGRLRPGVSREAAAQEMGVIAAGLAREHPEADKGWGVSARPLRDVLVENVRSAVWILFAAAGFLMLVACVNVSNLLLARAAGRRGEAAVRAALGAGRAVLMRGFLAESLIFALAGGVLGAVMAWGGLKPLLAACPVELSTVGPVGIDGRVLAFTLVVSILSALLSGSAAGWEGSRTDLAPVLNDSGRTTSGSRGARRFQAALVAAEIAIVLLLTVGSGVAFLAFHRLRQVRAGFTAEGAVTSRIVVPEARYPELSQRSALVRRLREGISGIPGVTAVGTTNKLPLDESYTLTSFLAEGEAPPKGDNGWTAHFRRVSPAYFATMGIPLAEGREFTDDDVEGRPLVAIVSRELARRHWPGISPIGKRLQRMGGTRPWMTVVGVAGDVRDLSLAADPPPTLYIPYYQGTTPLPEVAVVVRTSLPASAVARPIAERIAAVDPEVPAGPVVPLSTIVSESLVRQRFQMILMGLLACAGVALAGIGIFGLVSYTVSQQSRDLAIRMALGATAANVRSLVTGRGARLAAVGVAAGIGAVAAGGRILQNALPGTPAPGFVLVAAVAAGFGSLCVAASWLAARRAAAIAPASALAQAGAR